MPKTTERKIHFFRAHGDETDGGRVIPYNVRPALQSIQSLGFTDDSRYFGNGGERTICWPRSLTNPIRAQFGKKRLADLPTVEEHGNTRPLDLEAEEGILETIHLVFFPNHIVGMLFNFYGPRMSSFRRYLCAKHSSTPDTLRFTPLVRQDVLDALDKFGHIRVLTLGVLRPFVRQLQEFDESLFEAFNGIRQLGQAPRLEITLRPEAYQRDPIEGEGILDSIKRLARKVTSQPEWRDQIPRFDVKGENIEEDSIDEIDILSEKLVREKRVVKLDDRSRSVVEESAYEKIIEAYGELEDQLVAAASDFNDADKQLPSE